MTEARDSTMVVTTPAWEPCELSWRVASSEAPFDTSLFVDFTDEAGAHRRVGGFYDGDGWYRARFLPPHAGAWTWRTSSSDERLDGLGGRVTVTDPASPGPVQVAEDGFHFAHRDGTPFHPFGTTLYAWTHQDEQLQEQTLETLEAAPFNKVRMGVFPKSMPYNQNEPERTPFVADGEGGWDHSSFDTSFFQHLEGRIRQLGRLGIQVDLILWHPYDRWGFSSLPPHVDERYLRYIVRRLCAFPHIWWCVANEFDMVADKTDSDWDRLIGILREEDHVGHLLSMHNAFRYPEWDRPAYTHVSMQSIDRYRSAEAVVEWRERWGKPVIVDELRYEGDLEYNWGDLTGEELVRRAWEAIVRGGYVSHGETYWHPEDIVFWAKGGRLVGSSPERLRFLRRIVSECPTGRIEPIDGQEWDTPVGGVPHVYELHYFGIGRPRAFLGSVPEGANMNVDIIDTWAMTIDRVPGRFSGEFRIELPGTQYTAVRLTA